MADKLVRLSGLKTFLNSCLAIFVRKEAGKGLSTNDYTTAEKSKLAGLSNFDPKTLATVATSGSYNDLKDKPTNLSDLNNDTKYLTTDDADKTYAKKSDVSTVYHYKGSADTYAALPVNGMAVGDVYNIVAADDSHGIKAGDNVAWNGNTWDNLSGIEDLSAYSKKQTSILT